MQKKNAAGASIDRCSHITKNTIFCIYRYVHRETVLCQRSAAPPSICWCSNASFTAQSTEAWLRVDENPVSLSMSQVSGDSSGDQQVSAWIPKNSAIVHFEIASGSFGCYGAQSVPVSDRKITTDCPSQNSHCLVRWSMPSSEIQDSDRRACYTANTDATQVTFFRELPRLSTFSQKTVTYYSGQVLASSDRKPGAYDVRYSSSFVYVVNEEGGEIHFFTASSTQQEGSISIPDVDVTSVALQDSTVYVGIDDQSTIRVYRRIFSSSRYLHEHLTRYGWDNVCPSTKPRILQIDTHGSWVYYACGALNSHLPANVAIWRLDSETTRSVVKQEVISQIPGLRRMSLSSTGSILATDDDGYVRVYTPSDSPDGSYTQTARKRLGNGQQQEPWGIAGAGAGTLLVACNRYSRTEIHRTIFLVSESDPSAVLSVHASVPAKSGMLDQRVYLEGGMGYDASSDTVFTVVRYYNSGHLQHPPSNGQEQFLLVRISD